MISWTEYQRQAVEAENCSLAVSAAAGSGKTRVLTGRIIRLLSQGSVQASRLAVVTFTKAAAKGLEDRLYEELSKMVAEHPEDTRLSRQLMAISRAQISTIHSFCYSMIRSYGKELGLTGKERIADPLRLEPLKKKAIEDAVNDFLEGAGEKTEVRQSMYRVFGSARDLSGLYEALDRTFTAVSNLPGGMEELKKTVSQMEKECDEVEQGALPFGESSFGAPVAQAATDRFLSGAGTMDALLEPLSKTQFVGDKYIPFIEERKALMETCADLCKRSDFFGAAKLLKEGLAGSVPTVSKKSCPAEELVLKDQVKDVYNRIKKSLLAFAEKYLTTPLPSLLDEIRRSIALSREFLELAEFALSRYSDAKLKKNLLDYGDLEHYALKLVAEKTEDGWVKTPAGERITSELDALFVDEYQDSNGVQDLIFKSVTREDNLFIVGDPKQSIYRFRGAEPKIFSDYKKNLEVYKDGDSGKMRIIFLSDNFRCAQPVIDLVNRIFRVMMAGYRSDSLYQEKDELRFAKKPKEGEPPLPSPNTELLLVKKPAEVEEAKGVEEALLQDENLEAKYIAARIQALLDDYKAEDIAVICRTNGQIALMRSSLQKLMIPCNMGTGEVLSSDPEFLFVTSLIGALDNPRDDVALLGTMLSPIFRFDADNLYRIRLGKRKCFYYEALCRAAERGEEPERSRARELLDTLAALREKSKTLTLPALIFDLYRTLSIAQLYGSKTGAVKEFFLEAAESAESAEETSLNRFLTYVKRVAASSTTTENAPGVRLMTIHGSKGLEFPVVFASFLAKPFASKDENANLIISPELGPCFHLPEDGGRVKVNTYLRRAAVLEQRRALLEEEMRVLYVALTRPESRLIITAKPGSFATLKQDLVLCCEAPLKRELTELLLRNASSPLLMLLLSLRDSPALREVLENGGTQTDGTLTCATVIPPEVAPRAKTEEAKAAEERDPKALLSALDFTYEEEALARLPKKLSVSQLLRAGREEEASLIPRRLAQFTSSGLKKSPAQIGTITHSVMQFADFEALAADCDAELDRLVEKGFLTREDADLVEKDEIRAFFDSPLYLRMKNSPSLIREKRFNVLLPAKELLGSEGTVLVQGVIDAWFEEEDGTVTVVDFKTDRVKPEDGESVLLERHGEQLRLYALAVEQLTEKKVGHRLIFSFCLGKAIEA